MSGSDSSLCPMTAAPVSEDTAASSLNASLGSCSARINPLRRNPLVRSPCPTHSLEASIWELLCAPEIAPALRRSSITIGALPLRSSSEEDGGCRADDRRDEEEGEKEDISCSFIFFLPYRETFELDIDQDQYPHQRTKYSRIKILVRIKDCSENLLPGDRDKS